MFFTVVSPKYQTTLGFETRSIPGLRPGAKLKGIVEDGRIILVPVENVLDCYGALSRYAKHPSPTVAEETEAAEAGILEDALRGMKAE